MPIFKCNTGKYVRRRLNPGINTNHGQHYSLKTPDHLLEDEDDAFRGTVRTARAILGVLDSLFGAHILANQVIGAVLGAVHFPTWSGLKSPSQPSADLHSLFFQNHPRWRIFINNFYLKSSYRLKPISGTIIIIVKKYNFDFIAVLLLARGLKGECRTKAH